MIRKKWRDGEVVLSIETEDEFGKALATGEAVELTRELADQLGMMEDDTITEAEAREDCLIDTGSSGLVGITTFCIAASQIDFSIDQRSHIGHSPNLTT